MCKFCAIKLNTVAPPIIQSCSASIPFIDPFWGLEVAELKEDMPNLD